MEATKRSFSLLERAKMLLQVALNDRAKQSESERLAQQVYSLVDDAKYDFSKPFAEQVADWKDGSFPQKDALLIGGTPQVLTDDGLPALPMMINQRHVDYALNGTKDADHHLGEAFLAELPELIQKPIAVIESLTDNEHSLVMLVEWQNEGGQVVASVRVDSFGRQNNVRIDVNAVTSVFSKDNALTHLLQTAISKEAAGQTAIYYLDKEKASSLLSGAGLQLPEGRLSSGFGQSVNGPHSLVKPRTRNKTNPTRSKKPSA